ncbi:MAG: amino acid ABC transporter ATP-binding protein [Syntrophomonadaceae bacterium]|jgi:L-cystine transport system ATP-binding protein|nr:amino acid ABC transporter ATP-binding protein [Syntrophomonadaceae bacterium]
MIQVKQLFKTFSKQHVLNGIDFSIQKGEIVSILGSSGAGKTTLLRCINFLERAESGIVTIEDISVDCARPSNKDVLALRRKTAMVFQNYNLFRNKTALENVMEGLIIVKRWPKDKAKQRAMEELERVGMVIQADKYPSQLSGGQQQRVAIARAMALDPSIILFDEPTSALDPELTGEVLETIKAVAVTGATMLIVTHEIAFARDISHRIVFMDEGLIAESALTREFFSNTQNERARQFVQRIASIDYQI